MPGSCTPYTAKKDPNQATPPCPNQVTLAPAVALALALATVQAAAAACIELVLSAWPDAALRRVSAPVRRASGLGLGLGLGLEEET